MDAIRAGVASVLVLASCLKESIPESHTLAISHPTYDASIRRMLPASSKTKSRRSLRRAWLLLEQIRPFPDLPVLYPSARCCRNGATASSAEPPLHSAPGKISPGQAVRET